MTLTWLLPRSSPMKERFTAVDAVSMPTSAPLRGTRRVHPEERLLTVGAHEESLPAAGRQLRCPRSHDAVVGSQTLYRTPLLTV